MSIDSGSMDQHPELHWAAFDEEQSMQPATEPNNVSHERIIPTPHGKEPVTQAPSYTRNTPLSDVAPALQEGVKDLSPQDVHIIPERITPPSKNRKVWTKGQKIGAAIAAVAVVGGGVGATVIATGGNGRASHKTSSLPYPKPGQATVSFQPQPNTTIIAGNKTIPPSETTPPPSDMVVGVASPVGNIDPSYVGSYNLGNRTVQINWNGQPEQINALPVSTDPSSMANGVLNLFAATRTLDPSSPDWQTAASALTDSPYLQSSLRQWNQQFQTQHSTPYSDQEIFFSTVNSYVTFKNTGFDIDGNPVISLVSGSLRERSVKIGLKAPGAAAALDFGDPQAYALNESLPVTTFSFSYQSTPNGSFKVVHMDYSIG